MSISLKEASKVGAVRRSDRQLALNEAIMSAGAFLYILLCADGKYYVGTTRKSLEERVGEHNAGLHKSFTATRRPVTLVFAQHFDTITDAIAAERQIKGWSRAKKEAMIKGEWNQLPELAGRRTSHARQHTE